MLIDYVPIEVNRVTRRYVLGCDRRGCSLAGSVRPVSQAPGYIASNWPAKSGRIHCSVMPGRRDT